MDNEKTLIAAVLSGDLEAFGTLVRATQARVRLTCLILLGNAGEAEDAAQDVFVKAFKGLSNFRCDSSFETWLLSIANHHCLDTLRNRSRHPSESLDTLLEEKGAAFESLLSRSQAFNDTAAYTPEDRQLLGRLFGALPEEDRQVLTLREMENLPYEEIAGRLDCSLDAVKGRLKRARQNLIEKCRKFF